MARKALGRGLASLISDSSKKKNKASVSAKSAEDAKEGFFELPVEKIDASSHQPRKEFDDEKLHALAESIREQGLVQPVIVRKKKDRYELIAGERRLRAVTELEWKTVPAVIKDVSDNHIMEMALVENLQRADLNPLETAIAFQELRTDLKLTHDEISKRLGISRPQITNTLRLLELPEEIKQFIAAGELSQSHARSLLALPDPLSQIRLAKRIVEEGLSVRKVEEIVTGGSSRKEEKAPVQKETDPQTSQLEDRLRQHLNTKVVINHKKGKGSIQIEFYNNDEFSRIMDKIGLPGEID